MADRFRSEIKLARRVRHRNVCAIHDYGEDQGLLYISMEYLEGVDLKHMLRERGRAARRARPTRWRSRSRKACRPSTTRASSIAT